MNTHEVLSLITKSEREAAELILKAKDIISENKTDARNVVTEYDRAVQQLLVQRISSSCPEAEFFCEESSHPGKLDAAECFIIDPIDGTMNFVKGFHHSCISIAYSANGTVVCAAVYNPYTDEMFTALKGEGAWLNGRKLAIQDCPLKDSIACVGTSPYYPDKYEATNIISGKLMVNCLDIRRSGSAALDLCYVAAGRAGIYFELMLSLWDYAAGALIAQEAGARCCTPAGGPLIYTGEKAGVVCGTPAALSECSHIFKEIYTK